MMGMPKLASWEETVDLPVAIPPVRPMTVGTCQGVSMGTTRGRVGGSDDRFGEE